MPVPTFGGLNTTDTLQALRISNQTVVAYGADEVWSAVNAAFVAHNQLWREQTELMCTVTTQRLRRYGNPQGKTMEELDEFGQAQGQKARGGSDYGLPLRKFGAALGWNNDYFLMTTAKDFAGEVTQIFDADVNNFVKQIKRAFYLPTNYTFEDMLTDHASIPVKRLANADGLALPIGPNGEVFDATIHTHYLARAGGAFVQSDLAGLIATVTEHYQTGTVTVFIDASQENTIRTFADFVPYIYDGQTAAENTVRALGKTISAFQTFNRAIGLFRGAEVWVKPWTIPNYVLAMVTGPNIEKPLAIRVRGIMAPDGSIGAQLPSIINGGSTTTPGIGDLRLVATYSQFPMHAQEYQREFGIGAQNRVSTAVLYVGGTTYVSPTIT